MNAGKKQYKQIPIPEELDRVIWDSIGRAAREARRRRLRRWGLSAAAVFCAAFISANVAPLYAYAARIPVIGAVVQVLHVGSGGTRADGVHAGAAAEGETVEFYFESRAGELDTAPVYTVSHLLAPNRMVLTLHGVRTIDYEAIRESLLTTEAVRDVYRAMIGDDSMCGFIVVLNSGYTYELTEHTDPAGLSVRFYPDPAYQPEQTVYYLRSEAMPYGEGLGLLAERYPGKAAQLKTQSGEYIITVGQYGSLAEAEAALRALEETSGDASGLFVASGTADEVPEK